MEILSIFIVIIYSWRTSVSVWPSTFRSRNDTYIRYIISDTWSVDW